MTNYQGAPLNEQVKVLLEKNLEYSKEIFEISKKVKRYILWGRIMTALSLIIFVVLPIILGIVYLPSIFENMMSNFLPPGMGQSDVLQDLFGGQNVNQQDLMQTIEESGGPLNFYQNILDQYK